MKGKYVATSALVLLGVCALALFYFYRGEAPPTDNVPTDNVLENATLSIYTDPINAEVFVDNVSWGIAPQTREVPPSTYVVTFAPELGYETLPEQLVTLAENDFKIVRGCYVAVRPDTFVKLLKIKPLLENVVAATDYRYGARDDEGHGLDTIKIIENPEGGYLGVYHSRVGGVAPAPSVFNVRLAESEDLMNWRFVGTVEVDASQPTIAPAPNGAYIVAYEKHERSGSHLKFEYYADLASLLGCHSQKTFDASRTLSPAYEGTPNIYGISPDMSEIDVGFHYYWEGIVDRAARGTLGNLLGQSPSWTVCSRECYNDKLVAVGIGGNIGDRDYCELFGEEYTLQEAQFQKFEWGSWRVFLYDHSTGDFELLDIQTHKGSAAFANPTFTLLRSPSGAECLVVTYYIFGGEAGEGGPLIFYTEFVSG